MHILVVSRISIPAKDRTLPAWEYLRALGHRVTVEHPDSVPTDDMPDAIISMGVTIMSETEKALERFPGVPLYAFNWDVYAWVWEPGQEGKVQAYHPSRGKEYNYLQYGELLKRATEVWVPSYCTGLRTTQWWGINNWHVILSAAPTWEHDNVRDDGYALCTLRHIPDPWDTKFEKCCEAIGIPYKRTDHNLSYDDYVDAVAGCRFLVSHYYEASTGGLTLLEGYYHSKPVLLSDSEWHGGRDYFGDRANYFIYGNEDDFKRELRLMHDDPKSFVVEPQHRQWIQNKFSDTRMVNDMMRRIHAHAS